MSDDMVLKEKETVVIDQTVLSTITKRVVRLERENGIQKERNDSQMEEILKKVIEGELK